MREYKFRDKILDRYQILRIFNQGGMSAGVYYCHDLENADATTYSGSKRREVIVKILDVAGEPERGTDRVKQEVLTQSRFNHKNLVRIYDAHEEDGAIYIMMEYVKGAVGSNNLAGKLKQRGVLSIPEARFIFLQILEGIKILHGGTQKVIHLDLKPDNVLLTSDGSEVKVTDFGISALLGADNGVLSQENSARGTTGYVSPLFKYRDTADAVPLGPQYDYFALGVILFEMLTGVLPWEPDPKAKSDLMSCIEKAYKWYPPLLKSYDSRLTNDLYNIIFRLTATKPADRKFWYGSVDEIIDDVKKIGTFEEGKEPQLLVDQMRTPDFEQNTVYQVERRKRSQKFFLQPYYALTMAGSCVLLVAVAVFLGVFLGKGGL